MSKNNVFIPPNIARLMSPADRKAYGVLTPDEQKQRSELTLERNIHHEFGKWLYRHEFTDYYHSDPVKRPTIKKGLPDFGVYRDSRIIWIEFKVHPNWLSQDQEECFQRMGRNGNIIMICYASQEAEAIISKFFNLP